MIEVTINGTQHSLNVAPLRRLLDVLRIDLGLTGSKEGCGEGECGACTVLIEGKPVLSCLIPACQIDGAHIETIEGVAKGDTLHPLQRTFIDFGGAQCGICTPGMILAAKALLGSNADPTRLEIREALAGNLCRCTGYQKIIDAVEKAGAQLREVAP